MRSGAVPAGSEARRRPSSQVVGRVRRVGRVVAPVYRAAIGDPLRDGRLRLSGVGGKVHLLAALGVVALVGLGVSLLLGDEWRTGPLTFLRISAGRAVFAPTALYPITLVALAVAWILVMSGAVLAGAPVRFAAAVLFLAVNSPISRPVSVSSGGSLVETLAPAVSLAAFWAVTAAVVAISLFGERRAPRVRPVALIIVVIGIVALFGSHFAIFLSASERGLSVTGPFVLDGALVAAADLLVPLVLVAGVAVMRFGFTMSEAVVTGVAELPGRAAVGLLVATLVVKLWVELTPLDVWLTYLATQPAAVVRVLVSVAAFAAVGWVVRRWARDVDAAEGAEERVIYVSAAAVSAMTIANVVVLAAVAFLIVQANASAAAQTFLSWWPSDGLVLYGDLILAVALVVMGLMLVRRPRSVVMREAGIGLALVGAWLVPADVLAVLGIRVGFDDMLFDIAITLIVAVYVVLRWRRLTPGDALGLLGLTLFAWVALAKGDMIAAAGALLGLSAIVVVVFGVVWTVLTDSSFANGHSRLVPRPARLLLWVGYLVLSLAILDWVEATHATSFASERVDQGFFQLGIPVGAWLWLRRSFAPALGGIAP